ncbi:MAG: hypothetical protein HY290_04835 [Planctomycetia bacterium]|nr:hypothetical protein [Planctomycetia bacterium]
MQSVYWRERSKAAIRLFARRRVADASHCSFKGNPTSDLGSFQREVEASLSVLNQRVQDEDLFARIAWGEQSNRNGWSTQAGQLNFDGDTFELKLFNSSESQWNVDSIEITLKMFLEFPMHDAGMVCDLFHCQMDAWFVVHEDEPPIIFGVATSVPRRCLDGNVLAAAINSLRCASEEAMELLNYEFSDESDSAAR